MRPISSCGITALLPLDPLLRLPVCTPVIAGASRTRFPDANHVCAHSPKLSEQFRKPSNKSLAEVAINFQIVRTNG